MHDNKNNNEYDILVWVPLYSSFESVKSKIQFRDVQTPKICMSEKDQRFAIHSKMSEKTILEMN